MAALTAADILWMVYVGLFTCFSIPITVQFFRKRGSYFLKERHPHLALIQLGSMQTSWVMNTLVLPFVPPVSESGCPLRMLFVVCMDSVFLEVLIWRIWLLYWRTYLGDHLATMRQAIRKLNFRGDGRHKSKTSINSQVLTMRYSWGFKVAKYCVPAVLVLILIFDIVHLALSISIQACVGDSTRNGTEEGVLELIIARFALLVPFVLCLAVAVRNVKDHYKIAQEFRRYAKTLTVAAVLALPTSIMEDEAQGDHLRRYVIGITAQVLFVYCGFWPVYLQHKMERRIVAGDFGDVSSLEELLEDPAAVDSFAQYMKKEFCEEMLEFYQAVSHYQRMYELWTPEQQRNQALIIYASYVDASAPSQINISASALDEICIPLFGRTADSTQTSAQPIQDGTPRQSTFQTRLVPPADIFDDAQREMLKLMRDGPFQRFAVTQQPTASGTGVVPVAP